MGRKLENNRVLAAGVFAEELQFSHSVMSEKFYKSKLACRRLSGTVDYIPITISEYMIVPNEKWLGCPVCISGSFRSHNKDSHLLLSVFVDEIWVPDETDNEKDVNDIRLVGFICKIEKFRRTPYGREITNFFIAINHQYGKSFYIPCIAWGRAARYVSNLAIGSAVSVDGRIQSRDYAKVIGKGETETRTAYEVSIKNIREVPIEEAQVRREA